MKRKIINTLNNVADWIATTFYAGLIIFSLLCALILIGLGLVNTIEIAGEWVQ